VVSATILVKRSTGEPLKGHPLTALIQLDGRELLRIRLLTNAEGGALLQFNLPKKIERGDGLLAVLIDEGGVTESVSKRIPIVLNRIQLALFPEGGTLVNGLPTRVYFEAKDLLGKPADIEGQLRDDHGQLVAKFRSYHHGMGRFGFTPATGRTYHAEIRKPVGLAEHFALALAQETGCVLNSYDDFDEQFGAIRIRMRCTEPRRITVTAMLRENLLDAAALHVSAGKPAVVYLQPKLSGGPSHEPKGWPG
jgi:hypothetical protein